MIDFIGWVAGIMFAVSAIPQAYLTYTLGHAKNLSALTLWLWFWGEALMIVYFLSKHGFDAPLMTNYSINLLSVVVILRYKYLPREVNYESK